jgi:hypothetical protein
VFVSGKKAPFDVEEHAAGPAERRYELEESVDLDGEVRQYAHRVKPGELGVTCHFSTCSKAI